MRPPIHIPPAALSLDVPECVAMLRACAAEWRRLTAEKRTQSERPVQRTLAMAASMEAEADQFDALATALAALVESAALEHRMDSLARENPLRMIGFGFYPGKGFAATIDGTHVSQVSPTIRGALDAVLPPTP
jgi:hypothetical protein